MGEGHAGGNGEGGVGHSTDDVELGGRETTPHGLGHSVENVGVGDDDAKVDVDWGDEPGFEFELAEFDSLRMWICVHERQLVDRLPTPNNNRRTWISWSLRTNVS